MQQVSPFAIQGIGLSGQMHGVVLCDSQGEPLRPAILWADGRSHAQLSTYQQLSADLRHGLANPIVTGMAGPTLLWLRQHEPEVYHRARWALQPKDWLRFRLTGQVATDPSDASGTLLYDLVGDRWHTLLLTQLELRQDWLPPLLPATALAGTLTSDAAKHLGLPAEIPVAVGAADTAAAALGSGLTTPGAVQLTVGTGAQIIVLCPDPIPDPAGCTHLFRSALPQQWYRLAAIQNAGLALEWARQIVEMDWPQVYEEAFAVLPGCEGLIFLPYLTGDRTPHLNPNLRGAWIGLGLRHRRAHLMRAAMEGVAFSLAQGWQALQATGVSATALRLAGGGTTHPQWQQLLADVLQCPLYPTHYPDASARGAALLAQLAVEAATDPQEMFAERLFTRIAALTSGETAMEYTACIQPQPMSPDLAMAYASFCQQPRACHQY